MTNPVAPREIRVFLSSTFKDMDAERNHLIKLVFPKVRAACHARQVGFTEIDLRWGVTEEESKNGATVEICLKEINRCRDFPPFFIGFLGERYGWIPCHEDLEAYWTRHADSGYGKQIRQAVQRGISVTELEMELGILGNDDQPAAMPQANLTDHALFCLRSREFSQSLYTQAQGSAPPAKETDFIDPAGDRLAALKARIRQSGLLGLDNYASIEDFGAGIEAHLLAALDRYFPEGEIPTAQQRADAAHAAFRHQRLQNFLPRFDVRDALVAAIAKRIDQPLLGPVLLAGPSGQGKSALMADLARHLETTDSVIRFRVIDHYIGADEHNNLSAWIERLLRRLHPEIEDITGPIPKTEKPNDQRDALASWLTHAARRSESADPGCPVRFVLILDALDQLSDSGKDLELLKPEILGPDAILVISAADCTPARESTDSLDAIAVPPLTAELRAQLIACTLNHYKKSLPLALVEKLAQAPQSGSPLFLSLALEKLRLDARHETLSATCDAILEAPDAASLFLNAFLLDPDYSRPTQPDLALGFMALLGAARAGLTEIELADLLALADDPIAADTGEPRLPQRYLSHLVASFKPFLLDMGGNRIPMHRTFGESAMNAFGEVEIRETIYFRFRDSFRYDEKMNPFVERNADEALFQIAKLALLSHPKTDDARFQLVGDLRRVITPMVFTGWSSDVIKTALQILDGNEIETLSESWLDLIGMSRDYHRIFFSEVIAMLMEWMNEFAFSGYKLQHCVLSLMVQLQKELPDSTPEEIAATLVALGETCLYLDEYDQALSHFQRALEIQVKLFGPESDEVNTTRRLIAETLSQTGRERDIAQSRTFYESQIANGDEGSSTLTSLALILQYSGNSADFKAARALFEKSLNVCESTEGSHSASTAQALVNLAGYLDETGDAVDFAAARAMYERGIAIRERIYGIDDPATAHALHCFASYLDDTGDSDDFLRARQLFEQALATREKVFGPDHTNTAATLNNFANYLGTTGVKADAVRARELFERVLAIREKVLGPNSTQVAQALNNLAITIENSDDADRSVVAQSLLRRAIAIWDHCERSDHPEVATFCMSLARILASNGKSENLVEARPLYERALTIRENAYGKEHSDTRRSMEKLAATLETLGYDERSKTLRTELRDIQRRVMARESPDELATYDSLVATVREWAITTGDESPYFDFGEHLDFASYQWKGAGYGDTYRCFVDARTNPPSLSVYLYTAMNIPESMRSEILALIEPAEDDAGQLQLLSDEIQLRFFAYLDLADGTLSRDMISDSIKRGTVRLDAVSPEVRALLREDVLQTIAKDYSVELIAEDAEHVLFSGLGMDCWHFMLWHGGKYATRIRQVHVPRYALAEAVDHLLNTGEQTENVAMDWVPLWDDCKIGLGAGKRFHLDLLMTEQGLPVEICVLLQQDVPQLNRARMKVIQIDDHFVLTHEKTYSGHSVAAASRRLLDAIGFEKELYGKLDARRFGIYSAFCTMRDFFDRCPITQQELEAAVGLRHTIRVQFEYDPETISQEIRDIFADVQLKLLSQPVWGIGVDVPPDRAEIILGEGLARLSRVQRAQYALMNGMHSAGIFVPLAVVLGRINFETYVLYQTQNLDAHSKEEQSIRAEAAHIQLLGELAAADKYYGNSMTQDGQSSTIAIGYQSPSSTTLGDTPMRLTDTLKQWLTEQEWTEEPEIDEEKQTSSTGFVHTVGDFNLQCWFDISEKAEVLKFFAYFLDTKVPEKKLDEVQKFVTAVSNGMMLGNVQLLQEKRTIRYYHAIDVENASFEPAHITNMLNACLSNMETVLPQYMAICFGGKTTEEVLAEE